ncbi:MAG TPA: D-Ala-D-Ala carboxypeptidase family metallohydrolase [Allosphingosinicella sp.]
MPGEKLSDHFWLKELLVSSTADQLGIENKPTRAHLANLRNRLAPGLEAVRSVCGNRPIAVTSAYRNPRINAIVGGTATSAHPMGFAADLRVSGLSAWTTARLIAEAMLDGLKIDQLILESGRSVVHVSFDPRFRMMRGHQPGGPGTAIDWAYFD